MANQPDPKNVQRAMRVERELDAKVLKRFRTDESMSVKDAYIFALMFATKNVVLSAEDHERIAQDKRDAAAKLKGSKK
jgi:predicted nucleic acid-binding protein